MASKKSTFSALYLLLGAGAIIGFLVYSLFQRTNMGSKASKPDWAVQIQAIKRQCIDECKATFVAKVTTKEEKQACFEKCHNAALTIIPTFQQSK